MRNIIRCETWNAEHKSFTTAALEEAPAQDLAPNAFERGFIIQTPEGERFASRAEAGPIGKAAGHVREKADVTNLQSQELIEPVKEVVASPEPVREAPESEHVPSPPAPVGPVEPFVAAERMAAEAKAQAPGWETVPTIAPAKLDAYASKLPGAAKSVVLDVLVKGKSVDEAASAAGTTPKKAQELVGKATSFLGTARTVEPLAERSFTDEPSTGERRDAIDQRMAREERGRTIAETIFEKNGWPNQPGIWLASRIMKLTRVLGGILFLVSLQNPIQALSATLPSSYSVTLAWGSNASSDQITGYRVYYGVASGNYMNSVEVGNVTTNTVPSLTGGVTYFFAVTAHDALGLESEFSTEMIYTPGVQTVRIGATPTSQVVLTVAGQIGHTYYIQATQDFTTWTNIGAVTAGANGPVDFIDSNAASFLKRFYRTLDLQP